ncbi:hypothetical protein F4818DRAFT_191929 [Hypoxylon cercidicola]|nr:hypothetical protein F4818DRAFT_191929 [Hypoxylon cercidicola]
MCKQHVYTTTCSKPSCNAVLGSRKRNRYCPEALRARRLGHCAEGVQTEFQPSDTASRCHACKQRKTATAPRSGGRVKKEEHDDDDEKTAVSREIEDGDEEEDHESAGTVQFTCYYSAANRRDKMTPRSQSQSRYDDSDSESQRHQAQEPVKPRSKKRKLALLESFESDLATLEKEWERQPEPEPEPKSNGIRRRRACCDPVDQGLHADAANPYGFDGGVEREPDTFRRTKFLQKLLHELLD